MSSGLADLTWPEVAGRPTLVVPLGSLEQHGPHLPLDTDTRIAVALAERLAAAEPGCVVAPAVAYGASGEHQTFPGTLSIGSEALELLLVELVRSASATFARTVLVNGHGGNTETVSRAAARLTGESRPVRCWSPRHGGPTDSHAGRAETSLMLALAPALVHLDRASAGNTEPLADLLGRLRAGGVRSVSATGVLGDPTGAHAAEGVALLDRLASDLIADVRAWVAA
ncbi:MAG TPA: mycofactocin biosynthesis peptidyl-dipeptidase MftE [Mycobacteriales bacterium]|nr:mycofactocin biosynthesis peptidyl-dipeptidase MftE [Mycobacteriales bacterium]